MSRSHVLSTSDRAAASSTACLGLGLDTAEEFRSFMACSKAAMSASMASMASLYLASAWPRMTLPLPDTGRSPGWTTMQRSAVTRE